MPDPALQPNGPAVPLSEFARSVGPRLETIMVRRGGRPVPHTRVRQPGTENEIWLKLLRIDHANERHSLAEWHALIDGYRNGPAHPHDPRFCR